MGDKLLEVAKEMISKNVKFWLITEDENYIVVKTDKKDIKISKHQ